MNLTGREVNEWGDVIFNISGLIDRMMSGREISHDMVVKDLPEIHEFNDRCVEFDHPQDQIKIHTTPLEEPQVLHAQRQRRWFTPSSYADMDVLAWLLDRCTSESQTLRVAEEFLLFLERDMEPVLRHLIYLVDHFRSRGVIWGVGRGSSVASYILFIIGVHRVDSLRFDLDIREFLK